MEALVGGGLHPAPGEGSKLGLFSSDHALSPPRVLHLRTWCWWFWLLWPLFGAQLPWLGSLFLPPLPPSPSYLTSSSGCLGQLKEPNQKGEWEAWVGFPSRAHCLLRGTLTGLGGLIWFCAVVPWRQELLELPRCGLLGLEVDD